MKKERQPHTPSKKNVSRAVADLIRRADFLVALSGAGISTSAGIPDFRGQKGIYATGAYSPDVFDFETFRKDPRPFYAFARDFISREQNIAPTFAHSFLAGLEKQGKLKWTVTQNIDGLHQKAGSRNLLELHGSFQKNHCMSCWKEFSYGQLKEKMEQEPIPRCPCGGVVKPDIVFFGESVKGFEPAEKYVAQSDVLLVIGTSLAIYPVAYLPQLARGDIVAVNRGRVHLETPGVLLIDEDIDGFFKEVAALLE